MRAAEFITEAFNQPYATDLSDETEDGDYDSLTQLPDGSYLTVMFNNQGDGEYQVEFWRGPSQGVTGEGDAQRIFATVLSTIQRFIKEHNPWRLTFSATKDVEPGQNSESRAKLYNRLVDRYAAAWGYDAYNEDHGDQVEYELTRLKPNVAEGFPNFNREWDEATRYPEFVNLGKKKWIELVSKGKPVTVTRKNVNKINNTDAADPTSFKLLDPKKQKRALAQLAKGDVEMPIVARYSDGYLELIGGNTRLTAQMAKDGQAKVWLFNVPEELTQGVAEGQDDNGISFQVQKGKNKFATTLSIGNKPVGVYQYDADTGRSIAEVYPEFKGKGLGKLLVLHAIYTAAQLGLDFQEDESRTAEYDNVLDSLSSNGYIVDDDGYWYVTGEGEQYLQQSMKQGVAEGKHQNQQVVNAIQKVLPVAQEIWFHGSRATAKHRKNSDTDILVVVPDDLVGDQYLGTVRILQKLSTHFDNHDIQPTKSGTNIHRIAQEEGRLLWSNKQGVAEGLNFDEIYGKYLKVTDNNGDPGKPGFSLVTPLNGDSWNWRERPEFKDLVKQKLNDPGFLGDHKYQQIIDAMSGKQFDPTKHIAKENFADGKVKGKSRPGRVKRAGASCNGSVTDLRQRAKNASGEKAKMYHWCANMKSGKKK